MKIFEGKRKWILIAVAVAILYGVYTLFFRGPEELQVQIKEVGRGDVRQIVSVTGTVEADPEIDLRFQTVGTVNQILVEVGDEVEKDQVMAELENTDEKIKRDEALANLRLAQANLQLKEVGASAEDVAVSKAAVDSSLAALEAARIELENTRSRVLEDVRKSEIAVKDAEETLESRIQSFGTAEATFGSTEDTYEQNFDNAVVNSRLTASQSLISIQSALTEADNILGIDNTDFNNDFEDLLGVLNSATKINAEFSYKDAKAEFDLAKIYFEEVEGQESTEELVSDLLNRATTANILAQKSLSDTSVVLEATLTSTPFTPDVLDSKKNLIDTAKTSLNTVASNLETARQNIISAKLTIANQLNTQQSSLETAKLNKETAENNLSTARNNLIQANLKKKSDVDAAENAVKLREAEYNQSLASYNFKIAKARSVDLAGLIAQVQKARAALSLAESELAKTQLKAPSMGVVANVYFEEGENLNTTDIFIRMIASQKRIIANVSEVDITKVNLDDPVDITLDALPIERVFKAHIIDIDPAETLVQGVVYYQIRSVFDKEPKEVKPGMTANLEILASEKKDVLVIPTRAVKFGDESKFVEIQNEKGEIVEVPIQTGLEGDINTEVIKGLKEGDDVVTYSTNGS